VYSRSLTNLQAQHKSFNEWFNQLVINTDPRHPEAQAQNRVPIIYQHRRETDKFYELPTAMQNRLPGAVRSLMKRSAKVRVTYDQKTQRVLAAIVKVRVSDQHLHFPGLPLDCRFSLNLEMPWPDAIEELEGLGTTDPETMPDRNKDRLSYAQSHYQIDLTQVTQSVPGVNVSRVSPGAYEFSILTRPPAYSAHRERTRARDRARLTRLIRAGQSPESWRATSVSAANRRLRRQRAASGSKVTGVWRLDQASKEPFTRHGA
jgi:hypothetical protein